MKCPVCRENRTILQQVKYGEPHTLVSAPLYQISYPGSKNYVDPRCSECIDKLEARRAKK